MSTEAIAGFSPEEVSAIQEMYLDLELSPTELTLFLMRARKANLDPLSGQIIPTIRKTEKNGKFIRKMALVTSIDAFRLIADRTENYAPGRDTEYGPDDELYKLAPRFAKSYVKKRAGGEWHEYSGIAYYQEYVQFTGYGDKKKVAYMWDRMPRTMIEKCAEAKALRRGFPNELMGLYTHDEMAQADNPEETGNRFGEPPRKPKDVVEQPEKAKATEGKGREATGDGVPSPSIREEAVRAVHELSEMVKIRELENTLKMEHMAEVINGQPKPSKATEFAFGANAPSPDTVCDKTPQDCVRLPQDAPIVTKGTSTPTQTSTAKPTESAVPNNSIKKDVVISPAQLKRLVAIQSECKVTDDMLKEFLKTVKTQERPEGLASRRQIPKNVYDHVIAWIQGHKQ